MPDENNLMLCYNRGCGVSFDPSQNTDESCRHHPGAPVFHDAYKGWSCCNKKCTDFTEFLNIKGCTVSYHSNEKPPEPEKPKKEVPDEVIEYRPPITTVQEKRPPFDTPLVALKAEVAPSLKKELDALTATQVSPDGNEPDPTNIPIGTTCKNNSCKMVYEGPQTISTKCTFHPGYPVFHEGLKFWSCCTKRTTDFNTFLEQIGCNIGEHVWFKKKNEGEAKCRLDWHQTGSDVYITIYSKKCDPSASSVEVSPVRLKLSLYFPDQSATFNKDLHLMRMVNVDKSSVHYFSTKVEIKLAKNEPGSWSRLEVPSDKPSEDKTTKPSEENDAPTNKPIIEISEQVECVDLSCI